MMTTKQEDTESNRRAFLSTIRSDALSRPWSPVASEIVAIIDEVLP